MINTLICIKISIVSGNFGSTSICLQLVLAPTHRFQGFQGGTDTFAQLFVIYGPLLIFLYDLAIIVRVNPHVWRLILLQPFCSRFTALLFDALPT